MADKQALNATFFAFRKREKGGVLTTATIAYVIILIVVGGLYTVLNLAALASFFMMGASAEAGSFSPEAMAALTALGPVTLLLQIFMFVIAAAYEAACLKWMIRGETGGIFGFSFGADTWRVYFTYWIWFFLSLAAGIVFFVLLSGFVGSFFAVAAGGVKGPDLGVTGSVMTLVTIVLLLAMLWLSVRLAPAAATSIARQRFAFFDAWKVTKGRFWAMFGAFLLLIIMVIVACLVIYVVGGVAMVVGLGAQAATMQGQPSPEQMMAMITHPAVLIPLIVMYFGMFAVGLVATVAMLGVNARAAALALEEGRIKAG